MRSVRVLLGGVGQVEAVEARSGTAECERVWWGRTDMSRKGLARLGTSRPGMVRRSWIGMSGLGAAALGKAVEE